MLVGRRGAKPRGSAKGGSNAVAPDDGELTGAERDASVRDPQVHALAREIATRLAVRRPRRGSRAWSASGELVTTPYRGNADEIDLDRTLEALAERPALRPEDVFVRERRHLRRAVVLLVDVSGSMRGERVRTAAATVGALAAELARDDLSVIAFWSDAAILLPLGEPANARRLVDDLLRIPAQGLTNIAFPLELAADELASSQSRKRRVILLSDCVHNAGPDPRTVAGRLPRLDVLFELGGEHDIDLARDLARAGRGRLMPVRRHRDVVGALNAIFAR